MITAALWLYRALMGLLVPLALLVLGLRDRLKHKRRPSWSSRFMRPTPILPPDGLWIHAVSVGEVEVARRIISELKARSFHRPIILTVTTAAGLDLARKTLGDGVSVLASPIDLCGPVRRFLAAARPQALVLVETELWPEMLHQAGRLGLPVAVVNARLSQSSFRAYRRIRPLLGLLLRPLTLVLARDESDVERFCALGVDRRRIRVGGNVKYDLEQDDRPLAWEQTLVNLAAGRPVIVAGSTMDGEEAVVIEALKRLRTHNLQPLLVLAPRHPERFDRVFALLREHGLATVRRSRCNDSENNTADVFLIDTIGELARAYRFGDAAFIGGSLAPTGGHNPLEAAVWGVPVLTGPHVFNFEEIYNALFSAGAAQVVRDTEELANTLAEWLHDSATARDQGACGRAVIENNRGATRSIVDAVIELLAPEAG